MATRKVAIIDLQLIQAISLYLQEQPFKHVAGLLAGIERSQIVDMPDVGEPSFPSVKPVQPEIPLASAAKVNSQPKNGDKTVKTKAG